MAAPKNYTVRAMVSKADEPEIQRLMEKYPLWSRRTARETVARRNFRARIEAAGKKAV